MWRLSAPNPNDHGSEQTNGAGAAWKELVALLALGPEPEMRECPVCRQSVRRVATRCRSCWTKLTPPDESTEK